MTIQQRPAGTYSGEMFFDTLRICVRVLRERHRKSETQITVILKLCYSALGLPPNQSGARKVRITLQPNDTYRMEFFRLMALDPIKDLTHGDVYFDQLQEIFTLVTGFYTRL